MKYSLVNFKKNIKGFTLVELLISMTILAIMAALSVSAYPKFSEQISLTSETYNFLAFFRETQTYGVSAVATPGVKFVYAFVIDKSAGTLKRVQIENPTATNNTYYLTTAIPDSSSDVSSNIFTLKNIYEISEIHGIKNNSTTSLTTAYGFFKRPNPEARLVGLVGTNIAPDTDTGSFDKLEVTVRSKRNTQFTKKVVILSTGQMYVSDW